MSLQPSTISVGWDVAPTEVVVMECKSESLISAQSIYSMYIRRESIPFAQIHVGKAAEMSQNAPSDIKVKTPTLDGIIDVNNVYNSYLKATFLVSKMDCNDAKLYQCAVTYKPIGMDTTLGIAEMTLRVINVRPRDLQISAALIHEYGVDPIQNQSIIYKGEQVEFSCTGYIGSSQSTIIEWFKKKPPYMFFQRHFPTQANDTIDDGLTVSTPCEYMRTSKLRFTITSAETASAAFRCEVATHIYSGGEVRVRSEEFHLLPVLPRDLQISAALTDEYGVVPIQNRSLIDRGRQVDFSCRGYIGSSQSTKIQWFKKIHPKGLFQRHFPTQADDFIDDGIPVSTQFQYMRTSKLRFTMTTEETTRAAFRCEVAIQLSFGREVRVRSEEFHLTPGFCAINQLNGANRFTACASVLFWTSIYVFLTTVCCK